MEVRRAACRAHDRHNIRPEHADRIGVSPALAKRQHRREEIDQRLDLVSLRRTRACRIQGVCDGVGCDPEALLNVGGFGLDAERAFRGIEDPERRPNDDEQERRRNQQFDDAKAVVI